MLVLTRKYQEKIRIGDNITITVLRTKGKAVRLGIEAPTNVPVVRGELTFEAEPSAEAVSTVALEESESPKRRDRVGAVATATRWEMASETEPKVELSRVPRSKVSDMLPKLLSGSAPLRAMMEKGATR